MTAGPILILIDDEPILVRALGRMIGRDFEVKAFGSGREALEALRAAPTDVAILCHIHLPDMTGMRVHRELSSLRPDLAERIIFMTGSSTYPAMEKFLEKHRERVLLKPFSKEGSS